MYDIPERTDVKKVVITGETIEHGQPPMLVTETDDTEPRRRTAAEDRVVERARGIGVAGSSRSRYQWARTPSTSGCCVRAPFIRVGCPSSQSRLDGGQTEEPSTR